MKHFNKMTAALLPILILLVTSLPALAQPLNGNYTVYGSGADYPNLSAAASALSAGVSGPVTFKIRPGTWSSSSTSKATILAVSGASATNTITFEAENGNAATTIIRNTSSSSSTSNNMIFYFNNAKYVRVKNLTLARSSSSYQTMLRFGGSAQNNIVENCIFDGLGTTSSSSNAALIYTTSGSSVKDNIIRNNTGDGGSYFAYWRGSSSSSSSLSDNNEISGNTITNIGYYGFYLYYTKNMKVKNNTLTRTSSGTFYGLYMRYCDQGFDISGNKITRTGTTTSSSYGLYMYYCDGTSSNRGNLSNNTFDINTRGYIYNYSYYGNYYTIDGNTFNCTTTNRSLTPFYNYGSSSSNDKHIYITNNNINASTTSSITMYAHYRYASNGKFNNNKVNLKGRSTMYVYLAYQYCNNMQANGNEIKMDNTGSSSSRYFYTGYYPEDNQEFSGNDVTILGSSGYTYSYIFYYGLNNNGYTKVNDNKLYYRTTSSRSIYNYFCYYARKAEIVGNDIHVENNGSTIYGAYAYAYSSGSGPWIVKDNKVAALCNGSGTVYGFYNYYAQGLEMVNNSFTAKSNSTHYAYLGGYHYKNKGGAKVYNNSFAAVGSGTKYALYLYESSSSYEADVYNNVCYTASGSGYPFYGYNKNYYNMDYNNFYSASNGTIVRFTSTGGQHSAIQPLRNSTDQNWNSLSHDPGFTNVSIGDLRPNPANPNSWALNGRGVQIAGNGMDMNGNARALTTVTGVPDIGAYEFTPTSTPPDCDATPAAPAAGTDQIFTFGEDTVAVMHWGTNVPTGYSVKQYTGTNPPGILSINPTQMFSYIATAGTGSSLDYTQDLYYKDPWMGTIASESALRLAEKIGSNPWVGYSPTVSSSNTTRNFINTPGVDEAAGLFTGIDVKDNAGTDAIIDPAPPFCPGTYTVKVRIKNNGNNTINNVKISWSLNGTFQSTINHTTPITINGSPGGNSATITLGNIAFSNSAQNIKVWTHEPNGNADPVSGDDTLEVAYQAALQGTYTVGGTTPDYTTPVAAVNALNQFGTCGNVIFNIRPGVYTGQLMINNPQQVSGSSGRVTFQAENGNANSVTITHSTSGNGVIELQAADNFTFKNLTVSTASTGHPFGIYGKSDDDSIVGCKLYAPKVANTYNSCIYGYGYNTGFNPTNLVLKDNLMDGGYYCLWLYNYNTYTNGLVVDNNEIHGMYMGAYIYRTNGMKFTNNIVRAVDTRYSYYGLYCYYPYQSPVITGNDIESVRGYGAYVYQIQGSSSNYAQFRNNAIKLTNGTTTGYAGIQYYYCRYVDFIHNSISVSNTNSGAEGIYAYLSSSSYGNNKFYNNVFCNTGGGLAAYFYNYTTGSSTNKFDYNNYYATGSNLVSFRNSNKKTLAALQSSNNQDAHSITYDPGFTSNTNLLPNKANAASWSLNGRALQIAGDVADINGNPRVDQRVNGVPDIGAYEFTPEVLPPLAQGNPATAGAGDVQTFTFGEQPVAKVTWGTTLPITAPLNIRQFSGVREAALVTAPSTNSMYFYTDVEPQASGTTYDFDLDLNYMDIWLGNISSENNLRLGHKYSTFPWMVYSGTLSSVNTANNVIKASQLTVFDKFTGLEDGSIPSAFIKAQGSVVICYGNNVQLNAEPTTGDSYQWYLNGNAITGATGTSYLASQPGNYSVSITYGAPTNKTVESFPITVSAVAAPMAQVNASGPLTYCMGSGLTLDAGNQTGVKYQWQLNGNNIPGATGSTYPVNQAGNYTVVVENIGCATTSTITPVNAGPLNVSLGNDTSYCEIKNVWLNLDAGFPGAKYRWSTGDTTKSIQVNNTGDYWVEVDGGPNCVDRDTISVNIDPLPKSNGISYVKNGNTYSFSPSGPVGVNGYLWIFSDGSTSTQPNVTKTLKGGDLYVRLVMFNQCGSDTVQLGWPLSVETVVDGSNVQLYPNPARDQVTISVNGTTLESVQVLNSVGAVVYNGSAENGSNKHVVDLRALASGHYMLRAQTSDGMVSKPFDVMK